ncbi:MAG: ribonuclease J [Thermomicrobiales bacterium]|nr:ribonuclease J [Thermomicrobiales bacterium]MCO5226098.1 ribonuclease J [Thermomicrobiales bacterium]MCO5227995.1 ribonuclease J [Thermomicrobiales bacterium]
MSYVRIIFLGGVGEIGKNLMLFETEQDIIIVDYGLGFPDAEQLGVDLLLPDVGYLKGRSEKVRGIFITHGHEDHIGALPWLWEEVGAPIYATALTAGLIKSKMQERKLADKIELHIFDPDEHPMLTAGDFSLEPFRVTHSIPDACGFAITTPQGVIIVTGDFKFDPTPDDGKVTDKDTIRRYGDSGVRMLISDTTNAERSGHTPSETEVNDTLTEIFDIAPGRILLATFASMISRFQQVIDQAARTGKRVVPMGRSLENYVKVARELKYLNDPKEVLLTAKRADGVPDNRLVYLVTGSQGEPMAVLSRIANREHPRLTVKEGDTVVISASPIPGNETAVYRVIDLLFEAGAEVVYPGLARVHVSGHAYRDELREMIQLVRPQHVIPTHGEPRHLALYADLAVEEGIPRDRIHRVSIGDVVRLDEHGAFVADQIDVGTIVVEGQSVGLAHDPALRDRAAMANDGLISVAVAIDMQEGTIVSGPKVSTRGFSVITSDPELEQGIDDAVAEGLEKALLLGDSQGLHQAIRESAQKYVFSRTKRRPVILPLILEM